MQILLQTVIKLFAFGIFESFAASVLVASQDVWHRRDTIIFCFDKTRTISFSFFEGNVRGKRAAERLARKGSKEEQRAARHFKTITGEALSPALPVSAYHSET